ncbi:MAG TPA: hypothetical protein IAC75_05680 [Candidatus Spyradosoma merdigallinarum]|uniref:Uncharacterized protein n=1 Tax=Candidatus Spyradosoma merdigallinarum TaxID=2840950 RepID=A0A9D1NK65_9BACT|nr:hypothetical protein [Candidatus Spyradosoma merdigallinarum]
MKIRINPGTRRMLCLVGAMALGGGVPALFRPAGAFFENCAGDFVPPMVMLMLLFSFIDVKFSRESTGWSHLRIPLFMVALATCAYFAVGKLTGNEDFAVMAFLIGMTPTANAAPVITGLLGRREDYATVSVVSTNLFTAVALAPVSALVFGDALEIDTFSLAWKTMMLVGVPFALSVIFRNFMKPVAAFIRRWKFLSFYLWMVMLFTVCAQSSAYVSKQEHLSPTLLLEIFALAASLCAINFAAGYFLGEPRFRRECSQSLGQKNTMLMLWVGLAFFNPVVALGPTFYVVCHNLWNSWQLRHADVNETTIK